MKLIIAAISLLFILGCSPDKTSAKPTPKRGQNQYMVRYNVSGVPEIYTTDKVIWAGHTGAIKFIDQNGVPRTISGTFEIVHLSEIQN